jgi:hypothetical protein
MHATANAQKSVRIGPPAPLCGRKLLFQRQFPAMPAHGDRSAIGPPVQPPARARVWARKESFEPQKSVSIGQRDRPRGRNPRVSRQNPPRHLLRQILRPEF